MNNGYGATFLGVFLCFAQKLLIFSIQAFFRVSIKKIY